MSGWLRLAAAAGAIAVCWLAVLPWVASRHAVRSHIELLQQHDVDPSALFYTDLEAMPGVRERVAAARREHPRSFWQPAPRQALPPD